MARRRRCYVLGQSVHVFQRGHNRCAIFHGRCEYERFLTLLISAIQHYRVDVHFFALMTNHYHLVVTPSSATALRYRFYASGAQNDWLVPHALYEGLVRSTSERQLAYESICRQGSDSL